MSNLVDKLEIFENCRKKKEIKYYYVFRHNTSLKCALFVTNDDKVYGINIPLFVRTPSFKWFFERRINVHVIKFGSN